LEGLSFWRKVSFACAADRADPIGRKLLKRSAGFYSAIRIPIRWVIHITANIAYILFHLFLLWGIKIFASSGIIEKRVKNPCLPRASTHILLSPL
jgi:hypothetical protein